MEPGLVVPINIRIQVASSFIAGDVRIRPGNPFLHEGTDDPLGFAIRPRMFDFGEALVHTILRTEEAHRMVRSTFVFRSIVRIQALHSERQRSTNFFKEDRRGVASLVGQDVGVQPAREVINRNKEVFSRLYGSFAAHEGQSFGIGMYHLTGNRLLVSFEAMCFSRDSSCDLEFGLRQPPQAMMELPVPPIH